jgi:hypothetical protein
MPPTALAIRMTDKIADEAERPEHSAALRRSRSFHLRKRLRIQQSGLLAWPEPDEAESNHQP